MIQESTGKAPYYSNHEVGSQRLLLAIACFVEPLERRLFALFDTGAEWCVLPPNLCSALDIEVIEGQGDVFLSTRFGLLQGRLERVPMTLFADEGDQLSINATCFVSADWPGPMVIGWRGCLERMNFAFNNTEQAFYYAAGG